MRCVWVLVCAASLLAQDARFDVRSRLVLAPVAVADAFGRPISGLEGADFVVPGYSTSSHVHTIPLFAVTPASAKGTTKAGQKKGAKGQDRREARREDRSHQPERNRLEAGQVRRQAQEAGSAGRIEEGRRDRVAPA